MATSTHLGGSVPARLVADKSMGTLPDQSVADGLSRGEQLPHPGQPSCGVQSNQEVLIRPGGSGRDTAKSHTSPLESCWGLTEHSPAWPAAC